MHKYIYLNYKINNFTPCLDKKTLKRISNHIVTAPNPFIPKYPNRMVLLSIGNFFYLVNATIVINIYYIFLFRYFN